MTVQTFCPVCGAALTAGAEFCGSCGARVSATEGISTGTVANYAGFWQRFIALFIDGIILLFVAGIPAAILGLLADSPAIIYIVYGLIAVAYYAWGNGTGGTWGKQVIGIRVVALDNGADIGLGAGLGRAIVSWLGSIPILSRLVLDALGR